MKSPIQTLAKWTPHTTKAPPSQWSCICASVVMLWAAGWQCTASAQSDDFNDGNDTSPVAWMHYDAINTIFGAGPQDTWTFPNGNSYRLQAIASSDPGTTGPARVSSFPTNIYSDFYAAVDVVNWDNTYSQAIGLLARAGDFSAFGIPRTRGYMFIYVNGAEHISASAGDSECAEISGAGK